MRETVLFGCATTRRHRRAGGTRQRRRVLETIVVAILMGTLCVSLARSFDEDAKAALKKCEQAKFDFAAVIAACSEAIRLNPQNPFAYRRRGDAYLYDELARDYDKAIADYDE